MMLRNRRLFSNILIIIALFCVVASEAYSLDSSGVIWADSVIGVSSSAKARFNSTKMFSAEQALGKPSLMPDFGESPCTWTPDMNRKSIEWIKLGFASPNQTRQIAIYESTNPGAITKVLVYDDQGRETLVYNNLMPEPIYQSGRVLSIALKEMINNIKSVKIELSVKDYIDVYQIDAVALSSSMESIVPTINLPKEANAYKKENIGPSVNSQFHELGPVISADGKKLFFTRDQHPANTGRNMLQDVWLANARPDGSFAPAENLLEPINNDGNNFVAACSQDGNIIFIGNVYQADGKMNKGISQSEFDGGLWSFPKEIVINDYYNNSQNASFSFSANGKVMILSVERDDSFGKTDLYVSFIEQNGNWSKPINLGTSINTASDEVSPYLASDGVSLYFSSAGFPGFGKNDMFVARRLDSTWLNWSVPVNLGPSINSSGWDGYYTITASGDWAYFVSNENFADKEDIFRIKLPQSVKPLEVVMVRGKVLNAKTGLPLQANIVYETLDDAKNAGIAKSNKQTGEYTISLPGGRSYGFLAQAPGFASVNENIDLSQLDSFRIIERDLMLVPLESGQKVRLNNLFFETGKYDLLPNSYIELKRVIELLNENPKLSIAILGHTDNVGAASSNQILSEERAKAVYNYLINNGIAKNRMKFKGLGALQPTSSNQSEEGRAKNRRVEFVID